MSASGDGPKAAKKAAAMQGVPRGGLVTATPEVGGVLAAQDVERLEPDDGGVGVRRTRVEERGHPEAEREQHEEDPKRPRWRGGFHAFGCGQVRGRTRRSRPAVGNSFPSRGRIVP